MQNVERWDVFEVELAGPSDQNPFAEVTLAADFRLGHRVVRVDGFYDGDGTYRVRFMPDAEGEWTYTTVANRKALDGQTGRFVCVPATGTNRGPVHVRDTYHFAYADGTRYSCVGTTCYAWIHQPAARQDQTIATLRAAPFNKIRMCIFPKRYSYNQSDPEVYPYVRNADGTFDHTRFDPAFWHNLEHRLAQLRDLNIEADLILFHPYDENRWGFDRMSAEADDFYLRYAVARLAGYRNVWWSLANEWDFMKRKTVTDFDRFFHLLQQHDPYQRLRGIHNGSVWYDHNQPWVTHCSIQKHDTAEAAQMRAQYQKPVVYDECCYEGNIEWVWGNITAETMVRRFWDGFVRGGYVGHGETYLHPEDILWWGKGGTLHGASPARIAFLRQIVEDAPPLSPIAGMFGWEKSVGVGGVPGQYYLVYFGQFQPAVKEVTLPAEGAFTIELIDTWAMTIARLPGTYSGQVRLTLPGKPYMALRIQRQQA